MGHGAAMAASPASAPDSRPEPTVSTQTNIHGRSAFTTSPHTCLRHQPTTLAPPRHFSRHEGTRHGPAFVLWTRRPQAHRDNAEADGSILAIPFHHAPMMLRLHVLEIPFAIYLQSPGTQHTPRPRPANARPQAHQDNADADGPILASGLDNVDCALPTSEIGHSFV